MTQETYQQILTLLDSLNEQEKLQIISDITENLRTGQPFIEETEEEEPERKKPTYLPRMAQLLGWGVIEVGDRLHIKGYEDKPAMLLNKNEVAYDGHKMRINDWAKYITGWKAIRIYDWIIVERANSLLGELRKQAMLKRNMEYPE
ncbi:hypothetical protein MASR2M15_06890 [Anaerolineales bacterium]